MRAHLVAAAILVGSLLAAVPRPLIADSLVADSPSAGAGIERFMGEFAGSTVAPADQGLDARDLNVKITPHGHGFTLEWATVIHEAEGPKHHSYSIDFVPTERGDIFASAMRKDLFGHAEPMDPLKGDPYVWARLAGNTLTVYALVIGDGGGYEMQVYDRTLTADGMTLRFTRDRDGRELKTIAGTLKRVAN